MEVLEVYTHAKDSATPSEDQVALTAWGAAVIDGATPKSSFRFPDGETPGHYAARRLCAAFCNDVTAPQHLSQALLSPETAALAPAERPTASMVFYDDRRRCVTQIGDAPFAFVLDRGRLLEYRNAKEIDHLLSAWRSSILHSLLSRSICTPEEIFRHDPGRHIIQPFITRQVRFQNTVGSRYSFGVLDSQWIPPEHIHHYMLPEGTREVILASDGLPRLFPTLQQTLEYLQRLQQQDPLCIDALCGTKGLRPGATWADDVSYIRISVV